MNDIPKEPEFYKLYGSFYRRNSFGEFELVMLLGNTEEDIMCKIAAYFKISRKDILIMHLHEAILKEKKFVNIEIKLKEIEEEFLLTIKAPTIIL